MVKNELVGAIAERIEGAKKGDMLLYLIHTQRLLQIH